jgi:hypothetical protein
MYHWKGLHMTEGDQYEDTERWNDARKSGDERRLRPSPRHYPTRKEDQRKQALNPGHSNESQPVHLT